MNQKMQMCCGACEGEGYRSIPVPIPGHEDATDWTDADEQALCGGYCKGPACLTCNGSGSVLVLV